MKTLLKPYVLLLSLLLCQAGCTQCGDSKTTQHTQLNKLSITLLCDKGIAAAKEQKLQTYFIIYKCVCFCTQLCNVESTGCILVKLCASELCYVKYDII